MSKQFTVKQHWVPQFYLKHFVQKADQEKCYVTDVKRYYQGDGKYLPAGYGQPSRPARLPIENVAYIEYLYSDFDETTATFSNDLEDGLFHQIETSVGAVFQKILNGTVDLSINSDDRVQLAMFIANLHLRHPRMVAEVLGVARDQAPLGKELEHVKMRKEFRELQDFVAPLASMLMQRDWHLYRFSSDEIVTSDTPVFVTEGENMEVGSFESPTSTVFLPINHSRLLVLRGVAQPKLNHIAAVPDFPAERKSTIGAEVINRFIINYSEQYVYSSKELPAEWASDIT
ncbi:DUF4238 domain-containing protein [uncultured Herbaspirillum sp.]|uniref:DUF4238 domain-containing protein n=1 Tax=uncultured Herbaspirillum sp. TaxID=160236 RepID=UPI00258453AA|nr:DUF4238 domain-containing protein [uncultured Herbaspirillum sp.]